jgi:ketosteroid isomerase-like protein
MKKLLTLIVILSCQGIFAQADEAKATIERFFAAFHAQDTVALKSAMSDQIIFQSIAENKIPAKLTTETAADFIKGITGIPKTMKFEERLLSWKINATGSLAHVWTPYEFYINDKMSHRGINSFTLIKEAEGWKIVHCIDTRKK